MERSEDGALGDLCIDGVHVLTEWRLKRALRRIALLLNADIYPGTRARVKYLKY